MKRTMIVALAAALAGCSTYTTSRYAANADNVLALRAYRSHAAAVGPFTTTENGAQSSINCRGVGPIVTPDGEPFVEFIRKALVDELKFAEAYATDSRVTLTGRLDVVDFNSTGTAPVQSTSHMVRTGDEPAPLPPRWMLELTLISSNGRRLTAKETFTYAANYVGDIACQQTAQAFMPAVQNLIGRLVRAPEFGALLVP